MLFVLFRVVSGFDLCFFVSVCVIWGEIGEILLELKVFNEGLNDIWGFCGDLGVFFVIIFLELGVLFEIFNSCFDVGVFGVLLVWIIVCLNFFCCKVDVGKLRMFFGVWFWCVWIFKGGRWLLFLLNFFFLWWIFGYWIVCVFFGWCGLIFLNFSWSKCWLDCMLRVCGLFSFGEILYDLFEFFEEYGFVFCICWGLKFFVLVWDLIGFGGDFCWDFMFLEKFKFLLYFVIINFLFLKVIILFFFGLVFFLVCGVLRVEMFFFWVCFFFEELFDFFDLYFLFKLILDLVELCLCCVFFLLYIYL